MRSPSDEVDAHLDLLKTLCHGIARALGPHAEVVVHDFRRPEDSIVAIAGTVTSRSVGGSMSRLGLKLAADGDAAQDQYNYTTRTENGRVLRSSSLDTARFGRTCLRCTLHQHRRHGPASAERHPRRDGRSRLG